MSDTKYGPQIRGDIYINSFKEGKQPDYHAKKEYALSVSDEFLRHLVDALRTDGIEPRIGIALWENQDKQGNTSFGVRLTAVKHKPEEEAPAPEPAPQPAPTPAPTPAPDPFDDVPF